MKQLNDSAVFFRKIGWGNMLMLVVVILALATNLLIGCARDKASEMFAAVNSTNIQRVANLYCVYQAQNNFVGPKDESELKRFIAEMHPSRHKYFGVDVNRLDELFISERDKKPFRIRWELVAKPRQGPIPIAFESEGRNGMFMVAFSSFEVGEFEKFDYDQLWAGRRDEEMLNSNRGIPVEGSR